MSPWVAATLQLATVVVVLGALHVPVGDHLARVFTSTRHGRLERGVYRLVRVDPDVDQTWGAYAAGLLGVTFAGIGLLYLLQRVQGLLPLSGGMPAVSPAVALNTAVSFVTNTNWQSYSGEQTMGILTQTAGLAVQNVVSAAVGLSVAIVLVRGLVRRGTGQAGTGRVGNLWCDLVRSVTRVLLPLAFLVALVLLTQGVVDRKSVV